MKTARILTAGIAAMITAMGIARFSYTPMLNIMKGAGVLSVAQAGEIASINYLGYLVGSLFFMFKKIESKLKWFYLLYWVNGITLLLMCFTYNYLFWAGLRLISGFASAGMFILVSAVVLEQMAKTAKPQYAGIIYTGIGVGIFITGLTVLILSGKTTWNNMWLVFFIESVILFPFCYMGRDEKSTVGKSAAQETFVPMHPYIYVLSAAYFLMGAAYIVNGTFLVMIIDGIEGMKGFGGYAAWMITGLSAVPGIIYLSLASGRKGFLANLIPAYFVLGISCVLPAVTGSPYAAFLAASLYGATFLGIVSLTVAFSRKLGGSKTTYAVGLVTSAFGLGQMLGPAAAGYSAQMTGSFGSALMVSGLFCLMSIIILGVGCFYKNWRGICRM